MQKEPYIYTMPESFMLDDSVPAWWRLQGLLNGFWLNHLPFYATNEWIMKKLRCSEPTVSSAIKKLEEMNLIKCVRKGRNNRSIMPFKLQADPNELGSRPKPTLVTDPNQLIHNSDTNSDNIIPSETEVSDSRDISSLKENEILVGGRVLKTAPVNDNGEIKKVSQGKNYPNARQIFPLFGKYPYFWNKNKSFLESAEFLFNEVGIDGVKKAISVYNELKDEAFCPQIYTPKDLVEKWNKLYAFKEKQC